MSIPNRIWRVLRGRWRLADEGVRETLAEELAAQELADASQASGAPRSALPPSARQGPRPGAARPAAVGRAVDPLAADLALLGAPPACDMETLDRVYQERLAELEPAPQAAVDTNAAADRRAALSAAYERLRDAINTTETRFERLEF